MAIDWNHLIRVNDFDFVGLLYLITHRIWRVWFLRFPPSTAEGAATRERLRMGKTSIRFSQIVLLANHLCCIPGLNNPTALIMLRTLTLPSKPHPLPDLPILHQLLKQHRSSSFLRFVKDLISHFYLSKYPFDLCFSPTYIREIKWLQEASLFLGHALFFFVEFHSYILVWIFNEWMI